MKIIFLGVGEAISEQPNTSILIQDTKTILLDCGYSAAQVLWHYSTNPNLLDAIYISHLHADHYFGLAPLLLRMMEEHREKPITIMCVKGYASMIEQSLDLAFGEIFKHIQFPIQYQEVSADDTYHFEPYTFTFAPTNHYRGNLAVKMSNGRTIVCYSGDGRMTEASQKLYKNCNLLIHDAYHVKNKPMGTPMYHESIETLAQYGIDSGIEKIALVHINKKENMNDVSKQLIASMFVPKSGDIIEFS